MLLEVEQLWHVGDTYLKVRAFFLNICTLLGVIPQTSAHNECQLQHKGIGTASLLLRNLPMNPP